MLWKSRENVVILKWKDEQNVYAISNAHTTELMQATNRHDKELVKPNIVIDYHANMPGVDTSDQNFSYHSSLRKTVRWYKKVGVHIYETLLINAHYIYLKYCKGANPLNVMRFKEAIITELVAELNKTKAAQVKTDLLPRTDPSAEEKNNPFPKWKHRNCKNYNPRKELRYICALCPDQPAICVDPCFRLGHKHQHEQKSSLSSESGSNQSSSETESTSDFIDT